MKTMKELERQLDRQMETMHEMDEEIADYRLQIAEAQKAAKWTLITEGNLPKKGDEVLSLPLMHIQAVVTDPVMQYEMWKRFDWTHYRPIKPPAQPENREQNA